MKKLAGTWLVADKDGKPTDQVASIIKVTAGGSVVHETLFPGQPQEMVSIYTVDGPDLIMTHYCVLGNQPRMKADPKSSANQIVFQFAGGGNLDPKKDKHMHEATLTIVDDDHIEVKGTGMGKRRACEGYVLWAKSRSEEIARTTEIAAPCSSSHSLATSLDPFLPASPWRCRGLTHHARILAGESSAMPALGPKDRARGLLPVRETLRSMRPERHLAEVTIERNIPRG